MTTAKHSQTLSSQSLVEKCFWEDSFCFTQTRLPGFTLRNSTVGCFDDLILLMTNVDPYKSEDRIHLIPFLCARKKYISRIHDRLYNIYFLYILNISYIHNSNA